MNESTESANTPPLTDASIPPITVETGSLTPAPAAPPEASPAPAAPPEAPPAPAAPPEAPPAPAAPFVQGVSGGYICPECGKGGFKYRSQLIQRHIRHAHRLIADSVEARVPGGNGSPGAPLLPPRTTAPAASMPGARPTEALPAPDFSDLESEPRIEVPAPVKLPNYKQMGEMTFDLSTGIMVKVFGDEWKPSCPDERNTMVDAIRAYYESKQLPDIPPGMMLCFMIAVYSAPRFAAPATKNKLSLLWAWVKVKVFRRKPSKPSKLSVV